MNDIRPLAIWSARELTNADYGRIRVAKQALGLPFLVQFGKAVAGGSERVLAIGGEPDFLCDYAQIPNTYSAGLKPALEWVLSNKEDSRAMSMADVLTKWMGAEVREVTDAAGTSLVGSVGGERPGEPDSSNVQPYERGVHAGWGPRGRVDPGISNEQSFRSTFTAAVD